jgi:hypothetical protein
VRGRIHPLAAGVDVRENFRGADDGFGGGNDAVSFVDKMAERAAEVAVAFGEQASGVRVPIDRASADLKLSGDFVHAFPIDEGLVNRILEVEMTDLAVRHMHGAGGYGRVEAQSGPGGISTEDFFDSLLGGLRRARGRWLGGGDRRRRLVGGSGKFCGRIRRPRSSLDVLAGGVESGS